MNNKIYQYFRMLIKSIMLVVVTFAAILLFAGCKEQPYIGDENYDSSISLISYEIIDNEFDGVIYREINDFQKMAAKSEIPILIAFHQPMNELNIDVMPVLEEMSVIYDNRIQIVWIDAGKETGLAQQFSVRQTPQFTVIDQAVIKRTLVGFSDQGKEDLEELINPYLN